MTTEPDTFLNLVLDTKALLIWNREKGPLFWYTAGVPGPFFVNTEWVIGRDLASRLVEQITEILDAYADLAERGKQLDALIMTAYHENDQFKNVITALAAKTREAFKDGTYTLIAGGERRDWLFSIPLAHVLSLPHVFLFKDQSFYSVAPFTSGAAVLHVADLINNAASYFDRWLPALKKAGLTCTATICVNSRGHGAARLLESGVQVAALARVDVPLFEQLQQKNLIDQTTLDEIKLHAQAPSEWAEKYVMGRAELFDVTSADKKTFERMQVFFGQDPWQLRAKHAGFFDVIGAAIAARLKSAA